MDIEAEGEQTYIRIDPQTGTMTVDGEEQALPEGTATGIAGPFSVVISPQGEVLEMHVPAGIATLAGPMGMDMSQWMRMSQWQATFPQEAVGVGHVWAASMPPPIPGAEDVADEQALSPSGSLLFRLADVRMVDGAQTAQIEMLGAIDFESLPMGGPGMMGGAEDAGNLQVTIGPMHLSIVGTMDFDVEAGMVTVSQTTVIMDIVQHIEGTVTSPVGEQEQVNMEITTRSLTMDATVELAE